MYNLLDPLAPQGVFFVSFCRCEILDFSRFPSVSTYDFLGTGDLGVTAPFQGSNITFSTSSVDFGVGGTNNPAWTGSIVQPMF